jgi:hypothetical protein
MPKETLKLFDQIVNEEGHTHDPVHFVLVFNACMLKIPSPVARFNYSRC